VLIAIRWYFWRRGRKGSGSGPAGRPGRRPQPDPATAVDPRYVAGYPGSGYPGSGYSGSGYSGSEYSGSGYSGSGYSANYRDQGRTSAGAGNWNDERPPAPDYRRPRPGSGPYNFSSGA
jgi:hypothetical protein